MRLFDNRRGGFEDAADAFAGTVLFLLLILAVLFLSVSTDKEQDVMFEKYLFKTSAEQELMMFLKSTTPSGTSMADLLIDFDNVVNQAFFKREAENAFEPVFGNGKSIWSLVVQGEDGFELFIGDDYGSKKTISEIYLPSKNGILHIYLQLGRYDVEKIVRDSNMANVHRFE